jgi:DNA-binding SARP family transcriptional activator
VVLELRAFGPLEVSRDGAPVPIGSRLRRVLLAMLLAHRGEVVPVARLAASMWPQLPPAAVDRSLQIHVHRLRRGLGEAGLLTYRPPGYALVLAPEQIDICRFDELLRRGWAALADDRPAVAAGLLRQAVELCQGPAFQEFEDVPELAAAAGRIAERRLDAIETRIAAELAIGAHAEVVSELAALVAEHPLRERFRAQLMTALYRAGRVADALSVFREGRRLLVAELGIEPNRECRELERAILRDDPALMLPGRDRQPAGGGERPRVVPRQLPADLASFAGRAAELTQLDEWLDTRSGTNLAVIEGSPGVGKTTLAVHWAHRIRDRFPDGQLYLNLRGFHPSGTQMEPDQAIREFLAALEVSPARIPAGPDAQAGLYRSLLADRRVLVVLDNARSAEQVRPLLPGAPGSLVVVTSRDQLPGLVTTGDARVLQLDLPSHREAGDLLAGRLGGARVASEPDAITEIIAGCARLPLALAIVAARAVTTPGLGLAALARELDRSGAGLAAFQGTDPVTDVRAVFSWSYRTLSPPAARLFRLLGQYAGPDIAVTAAASLAGVPVPQARRLLAELTRTHLLGQPVPGRFSLHDLLRAYAAELAERQDPEADRHAALHQLLDHYLHTAHAAAVLLNPAREPIRAAAPGAGVSVVELVDHRQAVEWFRVEYPALVAAVELAARAGADAHSWQLARVLTTFQDRQGYWHDLAATHRTALRAARRLADRSAQAALHRLLARAYARLGSTAGAERHLREALRLYRRLGNQLGQAYAHQDLSKVLELRGRFRAALGHALQALGLYRGAGDRPGQASARNGVGWCRMLLEDYRQGLADCEAALALSREVGHRPGEAHIWDSLGFAHQHLGDRHQAAGCYRQALALHREQGDRYFEAQSLIHLGDVHAADHSGEIAREAYRRAWSILREIEHPEADQVQARLHAMATR